MGVGGVWRDICGRSVGDVRVLWRDIGGVWKGVGGSGKCVCVYL